MLEFKVNDYIKLKLERGKTNIYVNGVLFNQCKYILTRKKISELEDLLEMESVDELEESSIDNITRTLDHSLENVEPEFIDIPVETRFWVHCSNLQVWAENNYDTRLLHSNLSFPLLKRLAKAGDLTAKMVFKEEIAKRFASNYPSVINFLTEKGYDEYLSREEFFNSILSNNQADTMIELEKVVNMRYSLNDTVNKPLREDNGEKVYFAIDNRNVVELEFYYNETHPEYLLDLIHNFNKLKVLYLYLSEYTEIYPKTSRKFNSLLELKVAIYGWTKIPDIFDKFPNLKTLEIHGEGIVNELNSITKLKQLETLRLHYVNISNLPDSLGDLKSLKNLLITKTNIDTLPDSIGTLKNLSYLRLKRNNLKKLPDSIKNLKNLKKIELDKHLLENLRQEK
ncbi:MAG: leucine-rich repeat domain-containing protein [Candidatus Lokiarchaeota archaeon]|nr:leucine-rich repeat domain-containing protein [Candidatus Lokiarchaeota archaeon]